jgi:hypothetical protein
MHTKATMAAETPETPETPPEWFLVWCGVGQEEGTVLLKLSNGRTNVVLCEQRAECEKLLLQDEPVSSGVGKVMFFVDRVGDTVTLSWDDAGKTALTVKERGAATFMRAVADGLLEAE